MADVTVTPANVRPLTGAEVRRYNCGADVTPGQAVYVDTDGNVQPADADAAGSAQARGIALSNGSGSTSFASGERIDVVVEGPVTGYSGMTPGAVAFVSPTAGALDQTAPASAGDFVFAVGYAESATTLYVQPQTNVPVVNS